MRYVSTRRNCQPVSFEDAILQGLAPDGGLYLPEVTPQLPLHFLEHIAEYSLQEIGELTTSLFVENEVSKEGINHIIKNSLTFPAPITKLSDSLSVLELFHGPSLAFKDFGARFMAQTMGWFVKQKDNPLHILVATSGDTGGAVADGFLNVPGITVSILYPHGGVTEIQERQLTTNAGNVEAYRVEGTFDDCQRMVKEAFLDTELQERKNLSSANSINIARLIPQTFYYLYALSTMYSAGSPQKIPVSFSVPSGNLGNITAGVFAKKMGAPIKHLISATNVNDTLPRYLQSGSFKPRPAKSTISNAMDVGNPSNFERLDALYQGEHTGLSQEILGFAFDDQTTRAEMKKCLEQWSYLTEPHTAVAISAAREYLEKQRVQLANGESEVVIALGTAHPIKFSDTVEETCGTLPPMPESVRTIFQKEKQFTALPPSFAELKECLLSS